MKSLNKQKIKKPNLFLVGVPKSGTSSLNEFLKNHPEVFMSKLVGSSFFGEITNPDYPQLKNEKNYLALFSGVKDEKVIGDDCHYFTSKIAQKQIKKFNSNAKILIILRNPWDTSISRYKFMRGNKGYKGNKKGLKLFLKEESYHVKEVMYENMKYYENIKRYYNVFGRKNVHIIIFEDIIKNPKKNLLELCNFLKISPRTEGFKRVNPSRIIKNRWLLKIIQKIPSKVRLSLKLKLPKIIKLSKFIINKITMGKIINEGDKFKEIKIRLKKEFEPEVKKTGKLINKDLKKVWGYD